MSSPLEERITDLFSAHDVTPQDRTTIRNAFRPDLTFEQLAPEIQKLIEKNEQLPRQAWDDPMDIPDGFFEPEEPAPGAPLNPPRDSALSKFKGR